jgi:hypothetical protein
MHILNKQRLRATLISVNGFSDTFLSRGVSLGKGFRQMINEFARRDLTYQEDALNAFRGMLQELQTWSKHGMQSFRDWFGLPLFPSELKHTDALVYGLSWRIEDVVNDNVIGLESMPHQSQVGTIIRRNSFPSWTWLGWKISESSTFDFWGYPLEVLLSDKGVFDPGVPHKDLTSSPSYNSCVQVCVQYQNGQTLRWEEDQDVIIGQYLQQSLTPQLQINGWTFIVTISVSYLEPPEQSGMRYVKFRRFKIGRRDLGLAYSTLKSQGFVASSLNGKVRLQLLLLSRWSIPFRDRSLYPLDNMTAMVIAPFSMKDLDNAYEKVGLVNIHFYKRPHPRVWNDDLQCPGPDFRPTCLEKNIILK